MIIFLLLPGKIPWLVLILDFASAKFLQDKFTALLINMKLTQNYWEGISPNVAFIQYVHNKNSYFANGFIFCL